MAYDRKDHYHQRAKREGYRSRAAYKLLEIQQAQKLLRRGQRVIDLGCWPGGWLQVAAEAVGPKGRVAGVDLAAMDPPLENANVFAIVGDIAEPTVHARLLEFLGGPADVLLSDAAPKLTGIRVTDRAREEALLEAIEWVTPKLLAKGGTRLVKLLDCPEAAAFQQRTRKQFASTKVIKPKASRKGTTERYLLARDYRG
ncbi:MAG: RlmE family RNA methyltransferase [Myxococcota bacterium]|nr:RlmE family RNA methyltransferase [Myxococcota bacterium]